MNQARYDPAAFKATLLLEMRQHARRVVDWIPSALRQLRDVRLTNAERVEDPEFFAIANDAKALGTMVFRPEQWVYVIQSRSGDIQCAWHFHASVNGQVEKLEIDCDCGGWAGKVVCEHLSALAARIVDGLHRIQFEGP